MSSWIDLGIKELKAMEERVWSILSERFSTNEINQYLAEIEENIYELLAIAKRGDGLFTESAFMAISSLYSLRKLIKEVEDNPLPEDVPKETAARFALLAFRAGLSTGMVAPGRAVECLQWNQGKMKEEFTDKLNVAGEAAISDSARKSVSVRYEELNKIKDDAAVVAELLWVNGSELLHHDMADYLVDEYQDKNGRHPFLRLPGVKEGNEKKILRKVTKKVAKKMVRPDLVFNGFHLKID